MVFRVMCSEKSTTQNVLVFRCAGSRPLGDFSAPCYPNWVPEALAISALSFNLQYFARHSIVLVKDFPSCALFGILLLLIRLLVSKVGAICASPR
jgi:hypothetical protein